MIACPERMVVSRLLSAGSEDRRPLRALRSGFFSSDRLSILLFHRVLAERDPLSPGVPDGRSFERLLRHLRRVFNFLPLSEAVERLVAGELPPRALSLTFDDGYADNLKVAAPVLNALSAPATVFVTSGFLDGGLMWNDRVREALRRHPEGTAKLDFLGLGTRDLGSLPERAAIAEEVLKSIKYWHPREREQAVTELESRAPGRPPSLMLDCEGLRALALAGVEIGAHTQSHPILASLDEADARDEIQGSKAALEDALQREVRFFAYPNGRAGADYLPEHVSLVRQAGFSAALSTDGGANTPGVDPFQLQRFTPWDRNPFYFAARIAHHRGTARPGPSQQEDMDYEL